MAPSLRRAAFTLAALLAIAIVGCSSSPNDQSREAATAAATSSSAAPPTTKATASPSSSPVYLAKLPTTMTSDGGDCVRSGLCGYYVAGSSCKHVEWCSKEDLVEPGLWGTLGGDGGTDCSWGLSKPPDYGLDDGGYAAGYTEVTVPKGASFDTHDCAADWNWLGPA
jgi:hypothetical protein